MADILAAFDLSITDGWMILLGIPLFVLYWRVAEGCLFQPLLDLFEQRERATSGAKDQAAGILEEASRLETVSQETIDNARTEAVRERLARITIASQEASGIVGKSEGEAKATIAAGRQELSELEARLRSDLSTESKQLAEQLAQKILQAGSGVAASLLLVSAFLLMPEVVYAADGHGAVHVPSVTDTFVAWPNFLVFALVLFLLFRKPFLTHWVQRAESIAEAVNAGERARVAAEETLREAEQRYAQVDSEVKTLRERIAQESEAEAQRLVSEAGRKAENIARRAKESCESERNNLEVRLREELAGSVVEQARALLTDRITADTDASLRANVVKGAGALLQ